MPTSEEQEILDIQAELGAIEIAEIRKELAGLESNPSLTEELSGNMEELGTDLSERKQSIVDSAKDFASGEIGGHRAAINTLGDVAGGTFDVLGAGIESTVDVVGAGLSKALPNVTESVKDFTKSQFGDAATYIRNSASGKLGLEALTNGVEAYTEWAKESPQNAKTFESFVNVAMLLSPVKGKPAVSGELSLLNKASNVVKNSAQKTLDTASKKRAVKAVLSEKADAANLASTRTLGFRRTKQVPSKQEALIADELTKLNLTKRQSDSEIYHLVDNSITAKGASLSDDLAKSDIVIPDKAFNEAITKGIDDLTGLQLGLGSKEIKPIVEEVGKVATNIFKQFPNNPAGVLDARKELDNWLRRTGFEKLLVKDAAQTAQVESVRSIRDSINQVVIDAVPSAKVKARLESQSLLYRARDVLSDKAPKEARNSIGALFDALKHSTDISIPVTPVGLTLLASTGAAALGGGVGIAALTAGITFAGGKAIMSPSTRVGLAKLISGVDKTIKAGKLPVDQLKALRVHRAAVIELIENSEIDGSLEEQK